METIEVLEKKIHKKRTSCKLLDFCGNTNHKDDFYLKTVYFNRIHFKKYTFNIKEDSFQRLCFNL